jgi:hypothetical protein
MERDPEVFAPLEERLGSADTKSRVPRLHVAGETGAVGLSEA